MNERDDERTGPGDFALGDPLPQGATEPVDVVQVRADDAFIAAIGAGDDVRVHDPIDERLAELLQSWRADVHAEPEPLLDVSDAAAAAVVASSASSTASGRRRTRRPAGPFGPLAAAAAVLAIAFVGLGAAAKDAHPGDPLWNVTKVIYSEKAKSVEAAITVRTKLDQASVALQNGDDETAVEALQEARQQLPVVSPEDGKDQLATETALLMAVVDGTLAPPTTVPSSAPPAATSTTSRVARPVESSSPAGTVPPAPAAPPSTSAPATTTTETTQLPPSSQASPSTEVNNPTPDGSGSGDEPSAGSPTSLTA